MEAVAHLVAEAAEAGEPQRPAAKPAVDPVRDDALVGPPELTGSREQTASVADRTSV